MNSSNVALIELVDVLKDGESFYEQAALAASLEPLRTLFIQQAQWRRACRVEVEPKLSVQCAYPGGGQHTPHGIARGQYARLLRAMEHDEDLTYVDGIAAAEQRLLMFLRTFVEDDSLGLESILGIHGRNVQAACARMTDLKEQFQFQV